MSLSNPVTVINQNPPNHSHSESEFWIQYLSFNDSHLFRVLLGASSTTCRPVLPKRGGGRGWGGTGLLSQKVLKSQLAWRHRAKLCWPAWGPIVWRGPRTGLRDLKLLFSPSTHSNRPITFVPHRRSRFSALSFLGDYSLLQRGRARDLIQRRWWAVVGFHSYSLGAACSFSVGSSSVFCGGPLIL